MGGTNHTYYNARVLLFHYLSILILSYTCQFSNGDTIKAKASPPILVTWRYQYRCFQFSQSGVECREQANIGPEYPAPIASTRRAFFSATAPSHNAVGAPFVNAILPPRRKSSACDCGLLYFNQMVATKDWKERSSISYKQSVLAAEFPLRIAGIFLPTPPWNGWIFSHMIASSSNSICSNDLSS